LPIAGPCVAGWGRSVSRRFKVLAILMLAVAVPATAQTFGFSLGAAAPPACLSIGNTAYRVASETVRPDVTVRIDPAAATPDIRIQLTESADEADFVFVDDGNASPSCRQNSTRSVRIDAAAVAPDLTVGFGAGLATYRIYVRSRWLAPEIVAGLFAAAHMPMRTLAGRALDRSN
jgi:hypothetical protein